MSESFPITSRTQRHNEPRVISITMQAKNRYTLRRAGSDVDSRELTASIATRKPPNTPSADRRHTYATTLIEMGWPMALVQDQLGHTHVATTAVYTALSDDFKDRVLYRSLGMDWDDETAGAAR